MYLCLLDAISLRLMGPLQVCFLYILLSLFPLNLLSSLQLQTTSPYLRVPCPLVLYVFHPKCSLPTSYFYLIDILYLTCHFINTPCISYVLSSYQLLCPLVIFMHYMSGFFKHSLCCHFYNTSFPILSINHLSSLQLQTCLLAIYYASICFITIHSPKFLLIIIYLHLLYYLLIYSLHLYSNEPFQCPRSHKLPLFSFTSNLLCFF